MMKCMNDNLVKLLGIYLNQNKMHDGVIVLISHMIDELT
jgi:hypothetical protein